MGSVDRTQMLAATSTSAASAEVVGRNIEDLQVGDLVWSRDEETGEEGFKPVVRTFVNTIDTLVHLT